MALDPTKNPNLNFLHRLGVKNPVKILLAPGQKATTIVKVKQPTEPQEGIPPIDPRKTIKRPRKQANGIEIFDLGWYASDGELTTSITATAGGADKRIVTPLTQVQHEDFYDEIFATSLSSFTTTWRKLGLTDFQSQYYQFTLSRGPAFLDSATSPEFSTGKLILPSDYLSSSFLFLNTGYGANEHSLPKFVESVGIKGASSTFAKITNELDYDADAVVYTPTNKDKWFLMPTIRAPFFKAESRAGVTLISSDVWLDTHRPIPRALYMYTGTYQNDPLRSLDLALGTDLGDGYAGAHTHLDAIRSVLELPEAWRYSGGAWSSIAQNLVPDATKWPPSGALDPDYFSLLGTYYTDGSVEAVIRLTMVAKQGSTWYYFWRAN